MSTDETTRAEQLLDDLDPAAARVERTDDLRAVAAAADAVADDGARLTEAVEIARARGRSWTRIAHGSRRVPAGDAATLRRRHRRLTSGSLSR